MPNNIVGIILAGGLSRRMEGTEKSLMQLGDKPLIAHVAARLALQLETIVINANGDPSRFHQLNLPVVADTIDGFAGPLAGVLAGMRWAIKNAPQATHILTVAADTPFFPDNYEKQMRDALNKNPIDMPHIVLARSGEHRHPVFGLWPVQLADDLEKFLSIDENRKVMLFVKQYQLSDVDFPIEKINSQLRDPFFNINEPDDLQAATKKLQEMKASA